MAFYSDLRQDSSLAIDILGNPAIQTLSDEQKLRVATNNLHGLNEEYLITNGARVVLDDVGLPLMRRIAHSPGASVSELLEAHPEIEPDRIRSLITELCRQDILEPWF
ncbi:MAG: hypothetical protein L0H10_01855 [Comamonas sp.]|uniref:hypothetical protein n=1 Tax=Comamonas sp. TaxID=34028 RepID=UPI00264705AF|nr:hypothetical protein [Comamonas sp.]MDN5502555.1 hypothetical protein [Comamonas sp.]MDN5537725.1 hypothetical protein [Comamonas sp.]